jgi:hypothetical protein
MFYTFLKVGFSISLPLSVSTVAWRYLVPAKTGIGTAIFLYKHITSNLFQYRCEISYF